MLDLSGARLSLKFSSVPEPPKKSVQDDKYRSFTRAATLPSSRPLALFQGDKSNDSSHTKAIKTNLFKRNLSTHHSGVLKTYIYNFAGFIGMMVQNSQQSKEDKRGPPPEYEPTASPSKQLQEQLNTENGKILLSMMFSSLLTNLRFLSITIPPALMMEEP